MMSQRVHSGIPAGQSQVGGMEFGYVSSTQDMQYFRDKIKELEDEGKIPKLDQKAEYTIYRWKSTFLSHESVVLGFQGKFFTVEIRVLNKKVTLYTTGDDIKMTALKECGKKIATGFELINKAVEAYNTVQGYHFACNNCQDFVNHFLKTIELYDQVQDTDMNWLGKISLGVVVAGTALLFVFMGQNRKRKN